MTWSEADLRVRRLFRPTAEELEALARFDHEAFGPTGLRPCDLGLLALTGALFVACLDEEVVGSCQLLRMLEDPEALWMVGLYVRPEWRGRGMGKGLLGEIIGAMPLFCARSLVLTVDMANVAALTLYRSAGFQLLCEVPEIYGRGEGRHLMRLDLPKP